MHLSNRTVYDPAPSKAEQRFRIDAGTSMSRLDSGGVSVTCTRMASSQWGGSSKGRVSILVDLLDSIGNYLTPAVDGSQ